MFLAESGELNDDMSAEERRVEVPEVPIALEAGPRREGFDASGVLFLLPIILLAIISVGSCMPLPLSWNEGQPPADKRNRKRKEDLANH